MSLDSHCVYRSEELYRTWQLSQVWALSRDGILRPNDLKQVKLYQLVGVKLHHPRPISLRYSPTYLTGANISFLV